MSENDHDETRSDGMDPSKLPDLIVPTKPKAAKKAKPKAAKKAKPKAAKKAKPKAAKKAKPKAAARAYRVDMRLPESLKNKLYAKAKKSRRTITSLVQEAIENIK